MWLHQVQSDQSKEQDYQKAIQQPIFVSLYAPIENNKEWLGILVEVTAETITMEVKEKPRKTN